ncbi:MAG: UDP-N-acetylmuramoyl-tripeptide--D-alanyl-D-alanine ligase [Erysipelotrichaceae bacterium]|nr:UDP-N-acetylmuramoyl-tripeptide--D-alanyl-D-alanine ligase [Erysipelotrichaceae bacterium]
MRYLLWFIFFILNIINMAFSSKHALHMFQQNRYELPRYFGWLKQRKFGYDELVSMIGIIVLFLIPMFFMNYMIKIFWIVMIILIKVIIQYLVEKKKNYIKPLVFTARVKRQIVTLLIINAIFCGGFWYLSVQWWPVAFIFSTYSSWLLIVVVYYLNKPIEILINNHYLNEAKKIINNMPYLKKIGITGSYGKTSTKNIIFSVLSDEYYTLQTPHSYNTPMGITITIRKYLKPIHEVFICEMGADKVNEIDYLTKFVKPHFGIVTSIGPQHLNTFITLENIINEKMKMIENLPSDGVGFINMDNQYIRDYHIKNDCRLIKYGIKSRDVDYHVEDIEYSDKGSTFVIVDKCDVRYHFSTCLLGEHNIMNILVAVAVAKELGISWENLQSTIKDIQYVEHRLQLKKINDYTFIDNAFNSNPEGAAMSLEVLSRMSNKRFIITPGMIDLGEKQDEANREFGRQMLNKVDHVILVGKNQTISIVEGLKDVGFDQTKINVVDTVKQAFDLVYSIATVNDTILLENDLPDAFNR